MGDSAWQNVSSNSLDAVSVLWTFSFPLDILQISLNYTIALLSTKHVSTVPEACCARI